MANKVKRDSYAPLLLEDTLEKLTLNPVEPSEKEIPEKPKRKLRVSISVAVSPGGNEGTGDAECSQGLPTVGCITNCTPAKPARFVACCPLEEPVIGNVDNIGDAFAAGMLRGKGLPEQQNCPDDSRYPYSEGADGLPPYCRGCDEEDLQDCSLDRCSLAGDTNSVDTFTDDWTDSVSSHIASRCFVTRLVHCFCCLKPHDD
ncbi:uncharacterized protein LOC126299328 [Schistocerca gregaria]|uniref:uncharacterized protein LOC126299328 n=1 Tax=Schistocerca gregaria TaxID=7010 RepID=UPI00211EA89D|nr:uncharacterized protein LOC126299328 [Schistocerca gregaria]